MKKHPLTFFEFTAGERRGLIVLSLLILILLFFRFWMVLRPTGESRNFSEADYAAYKEFEQRQAFLADSAEQAWLQRRQQWNRKPASHQWQKPFRTAVAYNDSVRKFPETERVRKKTLSAPPTELNTADSTELQRVPGIGSKTAEYIITYRERLGGFVRMEQLLEIRIIDTLKYEKIKPYLSLDTGIVRKININTATAAELRQHPYVDAYLAKSIVNGRKNTKGGYRSLDEMKRATHVYQELYDKIKPYLDIR